MTRKNSYITLFLGLTMKLFQSLKCICVQKQSWSTIANMGRTFSTKKTHHKTNIHKPGEELSIGAVRKRKAEEFMKTLDIGNAQRKRRIEFMIEKLRAEGREVLLKPFENYYGCTLLFFFKTNSLLYLFTTSYSLSKHL